MTGAAVARALAERLNREPFAINGDFLKRVEIGSDFLVDQGTDARMTLTFESGIVAEIALARPLALGQPT